MFQAGTALQQYMGEPLRAGSQRGPVSARGSAHKQMALVACPDLTTTITLPSLVPSGPNQSYTNPCLSVPSLIAPEAQRGWLWLTSLIVLA